MEDVKYFRFAAREFHGKYGIVMVAGDDSGPDGGVTPVGPCDSSTPAGAMNKLRQALEQHMGPYVHPDHQKKS